MLRIIKHNLGVYFMVLACLDFALIGACAKLLSADLPAIEVVFFRNCIAAFYLLYLYKKSSLKPREGRHFMLLVFRGVMGVLSLYLLFYNIEHITLGGAYAFQKTAPIFTTLIAFFVFKEFIGLRGWLGIAVGFCGVLCGFFSAASVTSARELRHYYTTEKIVLAFMIVGTAVPMLSMLVGEFYAPQGLDFLLCAFKMPSLKAVFFIIIMGILGAVYQIHLTKSYGIAKKAGVSYLDVVFSLVLGLFLGDAFPSVMVFVGIVGIICGGLILISDKK